MWHTLAHASYYLCAITTLKLSAVRVLRYGVVSCLKEPGSLGRCNENLCQSFVLENANLLRVADPRSMLRICSPSGLNFPKPQQGRHRLKIV
jgi:hypothetical protein